MNLVLPEIVVAHLLAGAPCGKCGNVRRIARVGLPRLNDYEGDVATLTFPVSCACGAMEYVPVALPRAVLYAIVGYASIWAWRGKKRGRRERLATVPMVITPSEDAEALLRRCREAVADCSQRSRLPDPDEALAALTPAEVTASYLRVAADWAETGHSGHCLAQIAARERAFSHREPPGIVFVLAAEAIRSGKVGASLAALLREAARKVEKQ